MKLNRTGSNWTELERNKINENWRIIEGNYNNVVDKVSKEAFEKVVDSAKLNWKEPVGTVEDLPSNAEEGDTRMVREGADGIAEVYRYDGERWSKIQEFDATAINELDSRFTSQLADIEQRKVDKFEMNKFKADIMNNQNKFENNVNTALLAYLIELDAIRSIINANHANSITDGITTGLAE